MAPCTSSSSPTAALSRRTPEVGALLRGRQGSHPFLPICPWHVALAMVEVV
jgi:hypothetical protein